MAHEAGKCAHGAKKLEGKLSVGGSGIDVGKGCHNDRMIIYRTFGISHLTLFNKFIFVFVNTTQVRISCTIPASISASIIFINLHSI